MNDTYATYLQSEAWEKKRQQRITLSGGVCEACGTKDHLQVHHLTYERIFREEMGDLMTLCKMHHEAAEEMIQKGAIPRRGCVRIIAQQTMMFIAPKAAMKRRHDRTPKKPKAEQKSWLAQKREQKRTIRKQEADKIPAPFRDLNRKSKPAAFQKRLMEIPEFVAILKLPRAEYRKLARKLFGKCVLRGKIMANAATIRERVLKTIGERD